MSVLIIAEAGVNHNGDLETALRLCDAAKESGADIIKFQTWKTENILTLKAEMAEYQKINTGNDTTQFSMLKELELDYSAFEQIQDYCREIGIRFLSTPDDQESLDFLVDELKLDLIKIGSGEVGNTPFLRQIGRKGKPVILSTGMSDLGDVQNAVDELLDSGVKELSLLHCTTNYPCAMDEINLNAMNTLRQAFQLETGYSDHSLGIEVPIAAVACGASIIEKHFTLDKNMPGPDHKASLEPEEMKLMVSSIRNIESAMGSGLKKPCSSELKNIPVVRKSLVAACSIKKGERLSAENLTVKRPGTGINPVYWDLYIGKPAEKDYQRDDLI